jgi:hypothetical protein
MTSLVRVCRAAAARAWRAWASHGYLWQALQRSAGRWPLLGGDVEARRAARQQGEMSQTRASRTHVNVPRTAACRREGTPASRRLLRALRRSVVGLQAARALLLRDGRAGRARDGRAAEQAPCDARQGCARALGGPRCAGRLCDHELRRRLRRLRHRQLRLGCAHAFSAARWPMGGQLTADKLVDARECVGHVGEAALAEEGAKRRVHRHHLGLSPPATSVRASEAAGPQSVSARADSPRRRGCAGTRGGSALGTARNKQTNERTSSFRARSPLAHVCTSLGMSAETCGQPMPFSALARQASARLPTWSRGMRKDSVSVGRLKNRTLLTGFCAKTSAVRS